MGYAQVGDEDPRAHSQALVEGAEMRSEPCGLGQSPAPSTLGTFPAHHSLFLSLCFPWTPRSQTAVP